MNIQKSAAFLYTKTNYQKGNEENNPIYHCIKEGKKK